MLQNLNAGPDVGDGGGVDGENIAPVAMDDSANLVDGTNVTIDVLENDSDLDGMLIPASVSPTDPEFGNLDVNLLTGEITYIHDFSGPATDSFTYTVNDNAGELSNEATVTLEITPVDAPPVANDDSATVVDGGSVTIDILDNDTFTSLLDPSSVLATVPQHGSVALDDLAVDGSLIYSHDFSGPGTDAFSYSVKDSLGQESNLATVTVTVTDVSDASNRVVDGLLALYDFNAVSGSVVNDVSGVGVPLNLTIDDVANVRWGEGQLTLINPTAISSAGAATKISSVVTVNNEITLEAWIESDNLIQSGPARVVSVSSDSTNRNLTLGQDGSRYNVRLRTTTTGNNGFFPSTSSPNGTVDTELTHVVYTRDTESNVVIYVDGEVAVSGDITGNLSNWDLGYSLILGNEASGDRPWLGSFDLVAIYGRALSFEEVSQNYLVGVSGQ